MKFEGLVWRHVPAGAHPLHTGFILKAAGRWNRPGEYGCLYTALSREGADAEYRKYLERAGVRGALSPRELVSLQVTVDPVVDLTDGRSSPVPTDAPFLTGDGDEDWEACRRLADFLRGQGILGLVTPSAARGGVKNLVIYIDGPPRGLELEVGPDRIPWEAAGRRTVIGNQPLRTVVSAPGAAAYNPAPLRL